MADTVRRINKMRQAAAQCLPPMMEYAFEHEHLRTRHVRPTWNCRRMIICDGAETEVYLLGGGGAKLQLNPLPARRIPKAAGWTVGALAYVSQRVYRNDHTISEGRIALSGRLKGQPHPRHNVDVRCVPKTSTNTRLQFMGGCGPHVTHVHPASVAKVNGCITEAMNIQSKLYLTL